MLKNASKFFYWPQKSTSKNNTEMDEMCRPCHRPSWIIPRKTFTTTTNESGNHTHTWCSVWNSEVCQQSISSLFSFFFLFHGRDPILLPLINSWLLWHKWHMAHYKWLNVSSPQNMFLKIKGCNIKILDFNQQLIIKTRCK